MHSVMAKSKWPQMYTKLVQIYRSSFFFVCFVFYNYSKSVCCKKKVWRLGAGTQTHTWGAEKERCQERKEGREEGSKEGMKEGRLRVESLTLWNLIPCNFTSSFYPLVLRVNRSSLVAIRVWFPFWILAKQEVQKEAGKPRRIENIP